MSDLPRLQRPDARPGGRKPGPLPKGTCRGCGVVRSLRSDGTLFAHHLNIGFDYKVGYIRYRKCEGSHQLPATEETT